MTESRGQLAEEIATRHLLDQGLTLVERNYRRAWGELDIVMEDAGCLVFVEVRYRASQRFGDGAASITPAKILKLKNAARSFLRANPDMARRPCRFDVVSLTGALDRPAIRWIAGAFAD